MMVREYEGKEIREFHLWKSVMEDGERIRKYNRMEWNNAGEEILKGWKPWDLNNHRCKTDLESDIQYNEMLLTMRNGPWDAAWE